MPHYDIGPRPRTAETFRHLAIVTTAAGSRNRIDRDPLWISSRAILADRGLDRGDRVALLVNGLATEGEAVRAVFAPEPRLSAAPRWPRAAAELAVV
jgi:hypothetical protein